MTKMVQGKTAVDLCFFWNVSSIAWPPFPLFIRCMSNLDMRRRAVASSQAKTLSVSRVCAYPASKK